jgi:hypothetical protein
VSEVLTGKRELSMSMVRKLRERFHISADVLISPVWRRGRTRLVATSVKAGARGSFAGIRRGTSYSSHRSDYWIYAN